MTLFPKVKQMLVAEGAEDVVVFGGGIIPDDDATRLRQAGIEAVFGPGTDTRSIVQFIEGHPRFGAVAEAARA
jgi:methylmalonyl-CoA mutase C-terminal domain/subunit